MPATSREAIGELFVEFSADTQNAENSMDLLKKKAIETETALNKSMHGGGGTLGGMLGGGRGIGSIGDPLGGMGGKLAGGSAKGAASGGMGGPAAIVGLAIEHSLLGSLKKVGEVFLDLGLAGVRASADIQPLNTMLEKASRVIGGMFAPAIDFLTESFARLMPALRNVAEGFGNLLGSILETLKPVIDALIDAVKWLAEAFKKLMPSGGKHGYRELTPGHSGGMEDVAAMYNRIALAAVKQGPDRDYQKETADATRKTAADVEALKEINRDGNGLLKDIREKKGMAP